MVSEEGLEKGMFAKIRVFLEMIKFSHTVFALPFAFTGAVLAAGGMPSAHQVFWILMAMVGARTAAMGMNRLIDAEIDARNPRTASRAIPAGLIGTGTVILFIVLSILLMLYAAWQLNPLCLYLSPVSLFFLWLYSYCKRFTSLAHVVLGICLAAAPLGAWIAIRGTVEVPAILLGLAVLFWVAGFDILYALQDLDFDRASGLHSIPVRLGVNGSLWAARVFHLVMLGLLAGLYLSAGLGPWFLAGLAATITMLGYEHWLLRHGDLTKLDAAFFTMNGYISITLFVATLADVLAGRGGA
ncbi:4-hydroxybenzoate octaprenyltransferase [Geobacter anodireducens]|uniref:4-hydroxybenzoate polyprenyltransferase n=1 Tax=Geobacter soli TaxID=1510391 RepID=A0A0C1TTI7_9BACT|nr:4-hydroxybenzoate octaprenyltransferase [Geobacter soli]ANA41568.1 4-hydroxybenzoate octaprenyltransferase [Geobacter anodireducens]KIE44094.1 prenyltransferase [Geobacter soli]